MDRTILGLHTNCKEESPKSPKYRQTRYVSDQSPSFESLRIHLHNTSCYIQTPFSSCLSCDGTVFDGSTFLWRVYRIELFLKQPLEVDVLIFDVCRMEQELSDSRLGDVLKAA